MRNFFLGFFTATILLSCTMGVAAVTDVNRARIIIDLLFDGTTSNDALYANLDLANATVTTKYGTAFWTVFGPERDAMGNPIQNPTNAQLAAFWIKRMKIHNRDTLKASRVPAAVTAAANTEDAATTTEANSELNITP